MGFGFLKKKFALRLTIEYIDGRKQIGFFQKWYQKYNNFKDANGEWKYKVDSSKPRLATLHAWRKSDIPAMYETIEAAQKKQKRIIKIIEREAKKGKDRKPKKWNEKKMIQQHLETRRAMVDIILNLNIMEIVYLLVGIKQLNSGILMKHIEGAVMELTK